MSAIELKAITKTFGQHTAVDTLSLSVPEKSVYGFIGPNGSGKTTTLRMIMNILMPDRGDIKVFGETLQSSSSDHIGYMPEERGLYKRMKVRELLLLFGGLKNGKNLSTRVDDWLKRLDLTAWADKKVETLSKGMSQKVQFIMTVVAQPKLVILDEPFTGLDPVNTEVLKDAVLALQDQGATVVFSTHDMNMAEKMCDFIFMIYQGKKVLDGTLESIQNKYAQDTIRIQTDNGIADLKSLPGVESINDYGRMQELRITPDTNTNVILENLLQKTKVHKFEIAKPSLHDIFVRIAGPGTREVENE
jgi:ABC-2 type transport system ATP-binding protein